MNAVVVLCHFCESHGPAVVMCTQPYRLSDSPEGAMAESGIQLALGTTPANYIPSSKMGALTGGASGGTGPGMGGSSGALPLGHPIGSGSLGHTPCRACSSIPRDEPGLISNDHAAKTTYVSSQYPQEKLYAAVRQACVRSLSCEVCPGREGPIYFGDDYNGHVLSHTFQLKDSMARGLQGNFSILVLSRDKLFLLNAWPFLVGNIKRMISRLQECAQVVYEEEQSRQSTRAFRLGSGDLHPATYRCHRADGAELRSLTDLTKDEQVFYRIHSWFTWLLRAAGRRWTEHVLEGAPTEDEMVAREQRETPANEGQSDVDVLFAAETEMMGPEEQNLEMSNLRQLRQILGEDRFYTVAFHVVVGNQVLVRSDSPKANRAVLASLSRLLPRGCIKVVLDSKEYLPQFRCNFLDLAGRDVRVPEEVMLATADPCLLIDMTVEGGVVGGLLDKNQMTVRVRKNRPDTPRLRILDQISRLLSNPYPLPDSTVDLSLMAIREEWINKSRLVYSFKRCEAPSLAEAETERVYKGILGSLQCSPADETVVNFWKTGLSSHFKQNVCLVKRSF